MTENIHTVIHIITKYFPDFGSIFCALLASIVSIILARKNAKNEMNKLKEEFNLKSMVIQRENIYQIKKEAIFKALTTVDTYFSWLNLSEIVPIRKDTTTAALTEEVRDCYNRLCVTCKNATLLETFLDCFFGDSKDGKIPLELYNKFRNEARKELGLESLPLNTERIFLSVVSTAALLAKSPPQDAKSHGQPTSPNRQPLK